MDLLRWILLALVVALVAGIYLFESARRRRRDAAADPLLDDEDAALLEGLAAHHGDDYVLGDDDLPSISAGRERAARLDPDDLPSLSAARDNRDDGPLRRKDFPPPRKESRVYTVDPGPREPADELIVVLNVMAEPGHQFTGPEIQEAMAEVEAEFGEMQVFHHYGVAEMRAATPIFSIANILEPGVFDPARMETLETPGLCLFMRLPGPVDGAVAFELMLNTGQRLAAYLGGELRDDTRSVLTQQNIGRLRERIAALGQRRRSAPA